VEYALKAAVSGGNTAVAVRGATTSAFITQKKVYKLIFIVLYINYYIIINKVPDRLIDPTSMTCIYRITDSIGCLMLGLLPDVRAQVERYILIIIYI
jgi:20S proteasome subunit alpha 1